MEAQKSPRKAKLRAKPPAPAHSHPAPNLSLAEIDRERKAVSMVEAARMAGVSRGVIRQEIARGRLQAFRFGYRRIRITVEALTAYMKQRQAEGV